MTMLPCHIHLMVPFGPVTNHLFLICASEPFDHGPVGYVVCIRLMSQCALDVSGWPVGLVPDSRQFHVRPVGTYI